MGNYEAYQELKANLADAIDNGTFKDDEEMQRFAWNALTGAAAFGINPYMKWGMLADAAERLQNVSIDKLAAWGAADLTEGGYDAAEHAKCVLAYVADRKRLYSLLDEVARRADAVKEGQGWALADWETI